MIPPMTNLPGFTPQKAQSAAIAPFSRAQNHLSFSPLPLYLSGQMEIILSGWRALETMAKSSWEQLK